MKQTILIYILSIFGFVFVVCADAFFLDTPELFEKQQWSVGLALNARIPEYTAPIVFAQVGTKIPMDIQLKSGYQIAQYTNNKPYIGLESRFSILNDLGGADILTMTLGGHYRNVPGIDAGINVGNTYTMQHGNTLGFYTGVDCDIEFEQTALRVPGVLIIGMQHTINKQFRLTEEVSIPIIEDSYYGLGIAVSYIKQVH